MNEVAKVNKKELFERVACRLASESKGEAGTKARTYTIPDVCEAFLDEIIHAVECGERASLTGFGSFYAQTHRGHPVQFGSSAKKVSNYQVFKFAPSNVLNRRLRASGKLQK